MSAVEPRLLAELRGALVQMNQGLAAAAQGHNRAVRLLDGDMVDFSAEGTTKGASCLQMQTPAIIKPRAVKDVAVGEAIIDSLSEEELPFASRFQAAGADIGNRETSRSTKASRVESDATMDAFHELAMKDPMLKEDPTASLRADLEDESTNVFYIQGWCGRFTPIMHPENHWLFFWTLIGILFVVYECFLTPYRLCFNAPAEGIMFYFESGVNSYFLVDLVLQFFVSHRGPDGILIRNQSAIARKYLLGWFSIDAIAAMPIDWILIALGDEKQYAGVRAPKVLRLLRLSRFFKVARLLRLGKLRALADFEEEYMGSSREGKRMVIFGIGRIHGLKQGR
jgi:hypothetical protein